MAAACIAGSANAQASTDSLIDGDLHIITKALMMRLLRGRASPFVLAMVDDELSIELSSCVLIYRENDNLQQSQ